MNTIRSHFIILLLATVQCTGPTEGQRPALNKWTTSKMLSMLDAQDHRSREKLCALLKDENEVVREAAALAFASVQDSTSIPCLLSALNDASPVVRSATIFSLGLVADSAAFENMIVNTTQEKDSMVLSTLHSAIIMVAHRMPKRRSVEELVHLLRSSTGQDRTRAADALRRVDPVELNRISDTYLELISKENDPDVKALLVRGLSNFVLPEKDTLLLSMLGSEQPIAVRVNAARVLANSTNTQTLNELARGVADPEVTFRSAVLEALSKKATDLDPKILMQLRSKVEGFDPISKLRYYALLLSHNTTSGMAQDSIRRMVIRDPYAEAERFTAMAADETPAVELTMNSIMLSGAHPAMSNAAYQILADRTMKRMNMQRAIPRRTQVEQAVPFFRSVMESGNPGLISAAAETLQEVATEDLTTLFPKELETIALKPLKSIQDIEARSLIEALVSKRDGLPDPTHAGIPFNHPIDTVRLKQLPHGQRYAITTKKGTIIIATDVNGAPGSCLAFDSLVTAGYYNGKAFHRMVPNFVVQGGCPRGDGYGGMPWTLRTEIGRNSFTTGSLGLASAGRDTESCQFFITHSATPHLDSRYTRFGQVVNGLEVVLKLQVGDVIETIRRSEVD